MTPAESIRSFLPLLIGLIVGGVGVTLFMDSMPGAEGSPEERAKRLEVELKQAQTRIAALEAADFGGDSNTAAGRTTRPRRRSMRTAADGARSIADDLREGRPVNPQDIFRASQPVLRDLAPLFDRIRVRQQRQMIDAMTGELARKYDLTPQQQASLKQWFEERSNEEAKRWTELLSWDGTRLEDLIRATRDVRPDQGLDSFMEGVLSGDKLASFRAERIAERAQRVQKQADMKVQRLDSIVGLDERQRDQVFGVMARSSPDYDPRMVIEGASGEVGATPSGDRQQAILSVLTPDQRAAYEAERQRRREEANKDLEAIGLTLPPDWEMLDDSDFH